MAYRSPKQAYNFKKPWSQREIQNKTLSGKAALLSLFLGTLLLGDITLAGGDPAPAPMIELKPYRATYRVAKDGMVAEVKRELRQVSTDHWNLSDSGRILFFSLAESADVRVLDGQITPLHYRYRQGPGKSKNQDISYDWDRGRAKVILDDKTRSVEIQEPSYDKLALQLQLRLDLISGKLAQAQSYRMVDRGRVKYYHIEPIGEEILSLGKRQIPTIKLRQHTEGKDKETWIWVAPDLDYLIVQIVQEEDDERYEMRLESASLGQPGA